MLVKTRIHLKKKLCCIVFFFHERYNFIFIFFCLKDFTYILTFHEAIFQMHFVHLMLQNINSKFLHNLKLKRDFESGM